MIERRLSYTFGPLERRGIFGAIRAGQVATVALGAVLAVVALDWAPDLAGALFATLAILCAAGLATVPIRRRTAQEWAPVALSFAARRARRRARFCSLAPGRGMVIDHRNPRQQDGSPDPPRSLAGVRIVNVAYGDQSIGAISESGGRRLTAVIACRVVAFSLLDPEAQERRLARWGLVLSGAASTAIRRIQWVERTAPAGADELARWLHAERDPAVPLRGTPLIESYLELIGSTAKVTNEHEILLAVQVDAQRVHGRDAQAVSRTLVEQTEQLAQNLEAAEVSVLGALSARHLARALRTAFDPYGRAELGALEAADPARDGLAEINAWPLGARESWDHYCSDGAVHATYWIGGWPRVEVSPMFMDAVLGRSSTVRTVAVTFEPIPPDRSTREIEAAVTRDHADREVRRRFGQAETARQRQAQDATIRREAELAAGHGEVRLAGFVTVSGRDPDDLRRACSNVHEHAARARLELYRMYGQQADAFTFTLPLCRGLK